MSRQGLTVLVLVLAGVGYLVAEDPKPRTVRVSPSLLKEALKSQPQASAAAAPTMGRSIQDLQNLANDLEKSGLDSEAARLRGIIRNLARLAERRYAEKRDQLEKLQSEMDELKWAAERDHAHN